MTQDISARATHRIALITGGLKLGGSTTFLCNLAGELVRRRVPVRVFSFEGQHPLQPDFDRLGIEVIAQDDTRSIFEDRMLQVLRLVRHFKPTVMVACLGPSSFEALRYAPKGIFRLSVIQSDDPGVYRAMRFYVPCLDGIAAVSRRIQQRVRADSQLKNIPAHYLPYGVPMSDPVQHAGGVPGTPLRILYLGRLEREQKRVHLFPTILERLKASGIPFHWTIAGEGPEKGRLESVLKTSSSTQSVSFVGKVLYADVPRVLRDHDIFLLASDFEGLPLSLLEAMGAGLVPVVSDLPSGIEEVVDDTSGKRIPPDRTTGYAEAIIWLHHHREEMRQFSRNARAKVEREFSVHAMTDRWLRVLPASPAHEAVWPSQWSIRPPLPAPNHWRFTPPARMLRRLVLRLRG